MLWLERVRALDGAKIFGYDKSKEVNVMEEDLYFMDEALRLAAEAAAEGEVPVGCGIVRR